MPISLTNVSGTLDASIVDENNEAIEDFFKENILESDLESGKKFDKYIIRRHTAGRVVSFSLGSNPSVSPPNAFTTGVFESDWIGEEGYVLASDGATAMANDTSAGKYHPFEFLGFPGPSFYFDFQEDGWQNPDDISTTAFGSGTSSWPNTDIPQSRFPEDECWSRWLTVPHAAGKVYVDEPCVALITASVKGAFTMTSLMRNSSQSGTRTESQRFGKSGEASDITYYNFVNANMVRLGLFVDTNPVVHEDEFDQFTAQAGQSSNPNLEGTKCSWKKVNDITFKASQMGQYRIIGAVALKGRRYYNFSLKMRPAMQYGWNEWSGSSLTFHPEYFETNNITLNPNGDTSSPLSVVALNNRVDWFWCGADIPVTKYTETSSLHVDFYYGIDERTKSYTDTTFSTIA